MRIKRPVKDGHGEINLTPIIDMVFLLLIFFLTATKFADLERDVKIRPPTMHDNRPITAIPQEIVVNVYADAPYTVGDKQMSLDDIDRLLEMAVQQNPQQSVVIRGDRSANMQDAVDVLALCRKHNIDRTYLTTRQAGGN